jgi:hypothetical protein
MACAFSEHGGWLAARADLLVREFPQQQQRPRPVKRGDRPVMQDVDMVAVPLAWSR